MNKLNELIGPITSNTIDAVLVDIKNNTRKHGTIVSRLGQPFYVQKVIKGDRALSLQEIIQNFISKPLEEQAPLSQLRLRHRTVKEILDRKTTKINKLLRVVKFFYELIWKTITNYNKEIVLLKELEIKLNATNEPSSPSFSPLTNSSVQSTQIAFKSDSSPLTFSNKQVRFSDQKIIHDYKVDGVTIGSQEIHRFNSLDEDIHLCQSMIGFLTEKIRKVSQEPSKNQATILKQLNSKLNFYLKELTHVRQLKTEGQTWLHSNYFRHLIKKLVSYLEAIKQYVSVPINMRYQELLIAGKKVVGFFRLGIISDMRNGWFSMNDLKKMSHNPELIEKTIKRIKSEGGSRDRQKESIQHAISQLNHLIYKKNGKSIVNQEALDSLIEERQYVLEKQLLHLLNAQVEKNLEQIKASFEPHKKREFNLAHLALLNPKKVDHHKSGWMHDEQVEIEDMQCIFEIFKGKKIVFDSSGPIIDDQLIHLPYRLEGVPAAEAHVDLNTYFFNISTQGHMGNDGKQLELNKKEIKNLNIDSASLSESDKVLLDRLQGISKIPSKEKGYPIAEDFMVFLLKSKGMAVSVGCLSAKDRTGFISERVVLQHLPERYRDHPILRKQIFAANSPAVKVVSENTPGVTSLKINPLANVRGYDILEKLAVLARTVGSSD